MGEVKKGKETQVRGQIPQRLLHAYADLAGMPFENIFDDARDLWFWAECFAGDYVDVRHQFRKSVLVVAELITLELLSLVLILSSHII